MLKPLASYMNVQLGPKMLLIYIPGSDAPQTFYIYNAERLWLKFGHGLVTEIDMDNYWGIEGLIDVTKDHLTAPPGRFQTSSEIAYLHAPLKKSYAGIRNKYVDSGTRKQITAKPKVDQVFVVSRTLGLEFREVLSLLWHDR